MPWMSAVYMTLIREAVRSFPGKKILQEITTEKEDWDALLSEKHTNLS